MSQQAYPYDQYYGQTYPYPHGYSQSYSHRPPGSAGYGYDYPQSSQPPPPGSEERREGRRYYSNQSGSSSGYYEGGYPQAGGYTGYPTYHQSADGAYGNIHHGSPVAASYGSSAAYAAWRASHEVERRKSIISASRRSSATSITEVARRPSISEHPIGTPSPVTPVTSLERSPIIESPSREEQEASPTRSTASGLRTSSPEKKVTIGAASPISPAASDSPTAQASATANVPQAAENIKTVAEKPDHDISGAEACAGSIVLAASTFAEEHNNRVQKDAQLPVSSVASNANISQKAAEVPTSGRCEPKNTSMVRETSPRKEPLPAQSKSSTGLSSDESLSDLSDIPDSSSSDSEGLSEEQSGSSTSESEDNADGDSDAPEDYAPETVNILDDFSKPLLDPNDMDSDDFEYTDSAVTKSSSDELMKTPDRPRRRSYRGGAPRGRRRSDEDDGTNTRSRRIIESDSESDRDTSRSTSTGRPRSARSKKQVGRPRRERDDDDHAPDVAASAPGDEEKGVEEPVVPKKRGRPSLASKRALEELRKSQVELYEQANGSRARRNSIASVSVAGSESSATPTSRRPSTVSKARPEPGFYIEKRFVRMEKLNEPDRSGRTLLFKYAGRGDYSACQTLVGHGANVHPKDNAGWTALHEACLEGHCDIASLLIEHGADVNVPGDNDDTPLHDAVQRGHEQVVECLLLHGASIYAKNADGETPFSVADDDMKRVIKDWIANAADVLSFDDSGRTPLHHACHAGDEKAVLHNIRYGADVNQKDKAGWTPLHEAALQGRSSVCRILLDHGASVDAKGLRGDTPLLDAVTNGHAECVVILLRYGADATQKNDEGKSPMSVAESSEVRRLLSKKREEWMPFAVASKRVVRRMQDNASPSSAIVGTQPVMSSPEKTISNGNARRPSVSAALNAYTSQRRPSSEKNEYFRHGGLQNTGTPFQSERDRRKFEQMLKRIEKDEREKTVGHAIAPPTKEERKRKRTPSGTWEDEQQVEAAKTKVRNVEAKPNVDAPTLRRVDAGIDETNKKPEKKKLKPGVAQAKPKHKKKPVEIEVSSSDDHAPDEPAQGVKPVSEKPVSEKPVSEKPSNRMKRERRQSMEEDLSPGPPPEKKERRPKGPSGERKKALKESGQSQSIGKKKSGAVKKASRDSVTERKNSSDSTTAKEDSDLKPRNSSGSKAAKRSQQRGSGDGSGMEGITGYQRAAPPEPPQPAVDTARLALIREWRLIRCLPLYAIALPSDPAQRWLLDMQVGLLFGFKNGREFLERPEFQHLERRVVNEEEKKGLEGMAVAVSVLKAMVERNPKLAKWAKTIRLPTVDGQTDEGELGLRFTYYDVHFLKESDVIKEVDKLKERVREEGGEWVEDVSVVGVQLPTPKDI